MHVLNTEMPVFFFFFFFCNPWRLEGYSGQDTHNRIAGVHVWSIIRILVNVKLCRVSSLHTHTHMGRGTVERQAQKQGVLLSYFSATPLFSIGILSLLLLNREEKIGFALSCVTTVVSFSHCLFPTSAKRKLPVSVVFHCLWNHKDSKMQVNNAKKCLIFCLSITATFWNDARRLLE